MRELFENYMITGVIIGITLLGMVLKLMEEMFYRNILKQSENMQQAKNRFLRQLRQKFENYYHVNMQVHNIDSFVEKQLYRLKVLGLNWCKFNKNILFLGIVDIILGLVGGWLAWHWQLDRQYIVDIIAEALIGGLLLFMVACLTDMKYKKEVVQINIVDYLENTLMNRLLYEYREEKTVTLTSEERQMLLEPEPEGQRGKGKRQGREMEPLYDAAMETGQPRKAEYQQIRGGKLDREEEQVLEEVLQEYFP